MPDRLNEIVADIFEIDLQDLKDDLTSDDIELWDSLNHLRLITAVEEGLGVRFSMGEIESIDSIGALRRLVAERV